MLDFPILNSRKKFVFIQVNFLQELRGHVKKLCFFGIFALYRFQLLTLREGKDHSAISTNIGMMGSLFSIAIC